MAQPKPHPDLARLDPVWARITDEAEAAISDEPLMGGLIHACVLHHKTLEKALSYRFSAKLNSNEMSMVLLRDVAEEAYADDPSLVEAARADLAAIEERDPACHRLLQPILYYKGFQAMQAYRLGHHLWGRGRRDLAYFVQMRSSEVYGVDIHPGARIGKGIMIDHAHSKDRRRRADRGRGQGAGQHPGRLLLAHRGRVGGAVGGAREHHRGRGARQGGGRGGLRPARNHHGPDPEIRGLTPRCPVRRKAAPGSSAASIPLRSRPVRPASSSGFQGCP
jgi:hypothetical protein